MINFTNCFVRTFFHDLKNNIRFLGFRYLDSVELFVIEINAIFVGLLTHLAAKFLPVQGSAAFLFRNVESFTKPGSETFEVDVSDRANALTWSNQGVRF